VDERSLRTLLAKGERELTGGRRRGAARIWAAAGATLTAIAFYLGVPIARAAAFGFPRTLALFAAAVFGAVAAYCWLRLLRANS
jgi:hypothetical protein